MDLTEAAGMARGLMDEHGLRGWSFGYDRAKVRAGACHFVDQRITLSRVITAAHDESQVRETVLHEVAHAMVGPRHGHDQLWRRTARSIGASGQRCYTGEPVVPGRWQGRCVAGHEVQRHRRPSRVLLCTRCPQRRGRMLERVMAWTYDGRSVTEREIGPRFAADMRYLRERQGSG